MNKDSLDLPDITKSAKEQRLYSFMAIGTLTDKSVVAFVAGIGTGELLSRKL